MSCFGSHSRLFFGLYILAAALVGFAPSAWSATVKYIHTDMLGSVVAVTNEQGQVVERREYEPYGHQLVPIVADGPGYTGHVQDAATGLTYMQQRYYDPLIGRFLSVDPVAVRDRGDNFNRTQYGGNNPHSLFDPDGREERHPFSGSAGDSPSFHDGEHVSSRSMERFQVQFDAQFSDPAIGEANKVAGEYMLMGVDLAIPLPPVFTASRMGVRTAKTTTGMGPGLETRGLRPAPGTRVRPEGVPETWRVSPTRSEGGVQYTNPANTNQNVRVMQGNPNSPYPNSQGPYVRQQNAAGTFLRQDGTPSPLSRGGLRDGDAHIPLNQFIFRP